MPVFTGWFDLLKSIQRRRRREQPFLAPTGAVEPAAATREKWIGHAEENEGRAAFFIVHAKDVRAVPRKVEFFDSDRVFVGTSFAKLEASMFSASLGRWHRRKSASSSKHDGTRPASGLVVVVEIGDSHPPATKL
jgi:hypothetical protein